MKRFLVAALVMLICAGTVFALDPAEGYWLSVDSITGKVESGWEIYESEGHLLGRMLSALGTTAASRATRCRESYPDFPVAGNVKQLPVLGTPWIFGLRMESPGRWSNGNVIDPSNGSIYRCSLIYHPADGGRFQYETLEIRGQLLFFSGSQYWRRATREEAAALR
ncbi:MAG: DUF2147 domain-containing protein [Treponema sp.]|jgi:uncharacterized protein (DUF2147 family)|nr:DUF2147 domain-containing protein [Treponema sp.]